MKPVGDTLETMKENIGYDVDMHTFLKDQEIEDAYQTLKPVFDYLHEKFINESLEDKHTKEIDFSKYFDKYEVKKLQKLSAKDFKPIEDSLRSSFDAPYKNVAETWKKDAGKNTKNKDIFKKDSFKILTENGVLDYIEKNIEEYEGLVDKEKIQEALSRFRGFFTYFSGFNQNRENYYETKKEAATAVATRIVNENLPKFCDNILFFRDKKSEYLNIYDSLKADGKTLITKDKKELFPISKKIFSISHFNNCLSQKEIEHYNDEIGNANFLINLYNQQHNKDKGFKKLLLFKTLYKQIGCGKSESLFFTITDDRKEDAKEHKNIKSPVSLEEVLEIVDLFAKKLFIEKDEEIGVKSVPAFEKYLLSRENYEGVYWSKVAINTISNRYFANWHDLQDKLIDKKVFEKSKKGEEDKINIPDAIELSRLFDVIDETEGWQEGLYKDSILKDETKKDIIDNAESASLSLLQLIFADVDKDIKSFFDNSDEVLNLKNYSEKENKELIKKWLDDALSITQILRYFSVRENKVKSNSLDSTITEALKFMLRDATLEIEIGGEIKKEEADWFKWYDAVRNYLTKKPQDEMKDNKLKLNFQNSTLAGGWDINKEPDNFCVLFLDEEGNQFLGIIAKDKGSEKGFNKIFTKKGNNPLYKIEPDNLKWKKIEYKLLPGPNKMLPKCLLPKSDRNKYGADKEILDLYDDGSFKKNEPNFSMDKLHKLIDFYKNGLRRYDDWKCFNFSFKPTKDYKDISQFYSDVEKQGYKLDFIDINKNELDRLVKNGKVYLFEIKNQDYNKNKKNNHKNNLHTIYWQAVFKNMVNRPKLNGEAEIFYRKALSQDKLREKTDKTGKMIIENYRFSKDKFVFHVPITLNFCSRNNKVNDRINEYVRKKNDIQFLGIDRGEKHLAYYSLIDINGNILEQGSLNLPFLDKDGNQRTIKAEKRTIDQETGKEKVEIMECKNYNDLLEARAGDRDYARKNWQTIGTIKELKDGYISQVVRQIVDIATKSDKFTFIVLEDLNIGFKRGRQKIEKSVYQKLELSLAKKLNFLVDKEAEDGNIGSVAKAIQLTPPVNNFGDMENWKQFGNMLYIKADYTSQTDPVAGWRKSIYLKSGSEKSIKDQIRNSFSDIGYEHGDYYFEYKDTHGTIWKLYSGKDGTSMDRFHRERDNDRNIWVSKKQNINNILDILFKNFDKEKSIYKQLFEQEIELTRMPKESNGKERSAWESLRFTINLIQQIRNTGESEEDNDFILSPVRDKDGNHFDSRNTKNNQPTNGDANGAYNIARKGIIVSEHIKRGLNKLYIRDEEWGAWLAGKKTWEKWLKDNKDNLIKVKKITKLNARNL